MRDINIFPKILDFEKENPQAENLQIQTYGKRITKDQTVPEYLLEFLLVFIGENNGNKGFGKILKYDEVVEYSVNPNIGLKRFIFFDNSKTENKFKIDYKANSELNKLISENMITESINKKEMISILKDLYYGFAAVTRDRGWFAQALLPMSEQTIFCEAMGKKGKRKELEYYDEDENINIKVDSEFEFREHNFLARGGEVYFLHLVQGFNKIREDRGIEEEEKLRTNIEKYLFDLINSFPQFTNISEWILNQWYDELRKNAKPKDKNSDSYNEIKNVKDDLKRNGSCKWIIKEYERRAVHSVDEINNLLKNQTSEFEKFDLLSTGIVLQVLRMMTEAASIIANESEQTKTLWLMHIQTNYEADKKIKKLAVESYKKIEEDMIIAISKGLENKEFIINDGKKSKKKNTSDISLLKNAYDDSHKLLRKLGKDIGLIIPLKGDNMRFTLSDNIIRFLVLSLVVPGSKITIDTFLDKLYEHFGIVIGTKHYNQYIKDSDVGVTDVDASYLQYNLEEFQILLRKNGFLRELSDATSMVINPYNEFEVKI